MPKEKTTRKAKAVSGKKKKGTSTSSSLDLQSDFSNLLPDPNAPKRGLSAYMFFANDNREKVREDNPGIKFGKLFRSECASPASY